MNGAPDATVAQYLWCNIAVASECEAEPLREMWRHI